MDLGIELNTTRISICKKGKGIVLSEPNIVAKPKDNGRFCVVGKEAQEAIKENPKKYNIIYPIKYGMVADTDGATRILSTFIRKIYGELKFIMPKILLSIPTCSAMEKQTMVNIAKAAGARSVILLPQTLVSAFGAGIDIFYSKGFMIVNIEEDFTDIAVVSSGRVINATSLKLGMEKFLDDIEEYIYKTYKILINNDTKLWLRNKLHNVDGDYLYITGKYKDNKRLVKSITVKLQELLQQVNNKSGKKIISHISKIIDESHPELAADLINTGIILTGSGVSPTIDKLMKNKLGVRTFVSSNHHECVINGLIEILEDKKMINRIKTKEIY